MLRWPLDVQRASHQGRDVFILCDPSGITVNPAVIPAPLMPIVARFDGTNAIRQIVDEGSEFGVTEQLVFEMLEQLDQMLLLDNALSRSRLEELRKEFSEQRVREMAHGGEVYPKDRNALSEVIERYLADATRNWTAPDSGQNLIAMIAPHIDYRRGWNTYCAAFDIISSTDKPDVIFLFGTAHQPGDSIFHLTKKSFNCPYGVFPTEVEVVEALSRDYGKERAFRNEYLHKREHSIELQLPFLGHRYAAEGLPKLVPILVGSFHHCVESGKSPQEDAEIEDFVSALSAQIRELRSQGRSILLYGGVDLAHVGMHFGDTKRVSDDGLEGIESRDRELIERIIAADENMLFQHIAEDGDSRRICGFPSMFTMLAAMRRCDIKSTGSCLEYRQAVEPQSDCIVTFAAAAWNELH